MLVEGRLEGRLRLLRDVASRIGMLKEVWMKEVAEVVIAGIDIGRVCEILDASKEGVVYVESIVDTVWPWQV